MNSRSLQETDKGTPLEVLSPILFNTYKHHAGALRARIADLARGGPATLVELSEQTAVLGTKLMDLYTGAFTPRAICEKTIEQLRVSGHFELAAYSAWVASEGGYAQITFPEDESRWVLRVGDEQERYVHLHPGRWSPATVRVRANVLKTAFLVLVHVAIHGGDPMDRDLINAVRGEHLGLSPVGKAPEGETGLGSLIELLRSR